jgi:TRAP-type C4-dicarboxylate transport system substrate-binding protein
VQRIILKPKALLLRTLGSGASAHSRFKSDVETRTNGTLTVEIVYGGALGNPNSRMHLMRSGAIQMSDA